MCRTRLDRHPCLNYKCRHNLFWIGLKLNMDRIHMTGKALRIRNCARFINEPWTPEEIAEIWGVSKKKIEESEKSGRRKLSRRSHFKAGDLDDPAGRWQELTPA
jgi:hypothetical protein